jgi:exopolysaccharide biosynthesis protein
MTSEASKRASINYRKKRLKAGYRMVTVMLDDATIDNLARISTNKTEAIRKAAKIAAGELNHA